MLTVSDVAKRLRVSLPTVRNYARQFVDHLSSGASPPPGQRRNFTEEDLRVMATAKELLDAGLTYEEVRERLAEGVHLVEVEAPPAPQETETALVPIASVRLIIQPYIDQAELLRQERDRAFDRITELERELGRLEGQLKRKPWYLRLFGR